MLPVLLFDDGAACLGPLSDLRTAAEQRTGVLSALERWWATGALAGVASHSPPALLAERLTRLPHRAGGWTAPGADEALALATGARLAAGECLAINARSDARPSDVTGLGSGQALRAADGTVVAARIDASTSRALLGPASSRAAALATLAGLAPTQGPAVRVWSRPWHLLDQEALDARLTLDIAAVAASWSPPEHASVPSWAVVAGHGHVHVHASAKVGAGVVFDTAGGPVLVEAGAEIRHGAILVGPAAVGPGAIVAERAVLKARSIVGPMCRVGGELGSVIFQGFSNKAHDGHLGDALVGEWANLGAGTVNSNLLNTYGEVAMRLKPKGGLERTGRQFMGCLVGDHAKLAIGTRIMTGSSIGTGCMWAATAPISGAVASFAWVTDDGQRSYQAEKFLQVARTVLARRKATLGPAEEAALRALQAAAAGDLA